MKITMKTIDRLDRVTKAEQRAEKSILRRSGAYVRKIARDFVKHRGNPDVHSEPFHSPYDHYGLKESIIFGVGNHAVYIGPRYIKNGLANVARLHEFGGNAIVKCFDKHLYEGVTIGDIAPVSSSHFSRKYDVSVKRESRRDPKTGKAISWIRIRTKTQAAHASRLYRRLANTSTRRALVKYLPRPYMRPALHKSMPFLKGIWRQSIKN